MNSLRALGIVSVLASCTVSAHADEARAVVERAVKAMGGELDAAKRPATLVKFTFKNDEATGSGEFLYQPTKTRRCNIVGQDKTEKHTLTILLDGAAAQVETDGNKENIPEEALHSIRGIEVMFNPVGALPLLLENKSVSLKLLKETTFDGKQVQVVEAVVGGKQSVTIFFDQATGLPVKTSGIILFGPRLEVRLSDWHELGQDADERLLKEADIRVEPAALLEYLRKRVPDPAKAAQVAELIRKLGSDSFDDREQAGTDLVKLGAVAISSLERAMKDKDREIAQRAKECLDLLVKRNNDDVLAAAIRQVFWRKVEGGAEALLAMLPGVNEATQREAKAGLVAMFERDGKPAPALLKALDDKDAVISAAASAVLGRDGGAYLKEPGRRLYVRGQKVPAKFKVLESNKEVAELEITDAQSFNLFDAKLFTKP